MVKNADLEIKFEGNSFRRWDAALFEENRPSGRSEGQLFCDVGAMLTESKRLGRDRIFKISIRHSKHGKCLAELLVKQKRNATK